MTYRVERLSPGRIRLSSYLFQYLHHPEETLHSYFSKFGGVRKVSYSKKSGRLTLEYDTNSFDLIGFLSHVENTPRDVFLEDLSREKPKLHKKENGAKGWFVLSTLGLIPY
ncbi:MAG: hypothetical protein NZ851_03810, partial [Aquificaceae bacterium]|nr:hypothetical protein [Aquificaceae bacterium]